MISSIFISLSENILKVTLNEQDDFKGVSVQLPPECVDGSRILNSAEIANQVNTILANSFNVKSKQATLSFAVEPQDIFLKFITVNKKNGNVEEQIIAEAKTKLEGKNIDDMYFSFQKIAPFVYQFMAIEKDRMNKYLEIAQELKMELKNVIPWVLMLPKLVNTNDPCIFVAKNRNIQSLSLSELGGIYFSSILETQRSPEELQQLISELSVYKRSSPITKIYTLNTEFFTLDPSYDVQALSISENQTAQSLEYSTHLICERVLETDPGLVNMQVNLLNMLPLPVVAKKNTNLVLVGAGIGVAVLVFGVLLGGKLLGGKGNTTDLASNNSPMVLSDTSKEPTQSTPAVTEPKVDLKKADLTIRVENGAGIPGVAAKARDFLKPLGYNVTEIGNYEDGDRDTTLIKIKASKVAYKDLLLNDMKGTYQVSLEDTLPESSNVDALVIIGAK